MPKAENTKQKLTRVRMRPNKNWSDEECLSMLYYILDRQNEGTQFEKPTAEMFYSKMFKQLEWDNIKWQQTKAKLCNFRTKYLEVKKWLEGTGQGVDSGTIEAFINTKCKFYDLLHGIYGGRANINVPYAYDSLRRNESQPNIEGANRNIDRVQSNAVEDVLGEAEGVLGEVNDEMGIVIDNDEMEMEVLSIVDVDNFFGSPSSEVTDEIDPFIGIERTHTNIGSQEKSTENTHHSELDSDVECFNSERSDLQEIISLTNSPEKTSNTSRTNPKEPFSITEEDWAFARFASDPPDPEAEHGNNDSRIARYKKQLSERPSGKQSQPHKREIPSNAAAFISDSNLKRAETLQEQNKIEMRRVENENIEMEISKERFELDKVLHLEQIKLNKKEIGFKDQELNLKEAELRGKLDLRQQNFDLKCKKLAMKEKEKEDDFKFKLLKLEKNERLENFKIECDFKLQLELAKLKQKP